MQLLTDSEKNRIKRDIGNAFNTILFQVRVKQILRMPAVSRTDAQFDKVIQFLKQLDVFKDDLNDFDYQDWKELAQAMNIKACSDGQMIYDLHDSPKQFYIVLSGQVITKIKNPKINKWDWIKQTLDGLLQWKTMIFDKRF